MFTHRNTQHLLRCQAVIQSNKWPHYRVCRAPERRMVTSLGGRRQAVRPAGFKVRICWRSLKLRLCRLTGMVHSGKCQGSVHTSNQVMTDTFQIHTYSLFTSHKAIWRNMICDMDNVLVSDCKNKQQTHTVCNMSCLLVVWHNFRRNLHMCRRLDVVCFEYVIDIIVNGIGDSLWLWLRSGVPLDNEDNKFSINESLDL